MADQFDSRRRIEQEDLQPGGRLAPRDTTPSPIPGVTPTGTPRANQGITQANTLQQLINDLSSTLLGGGGALRQQRAGAVNIGFDRAQQQLLEQFAGRGTLGSGVAAQGLAELGGKRAAALGQTEADIQNQLINQILGVSGQQLAGERFQEGVRQFDVGQEFREKQFEEGIRQFQEQLRLQKANQPDFLGSLFGGALGIATGGVAQGAGSALTKAIFG